MGPAQRAPRVLQGAKQPVEGLETSCPWPGQGVLCSTTTRNGPAWPPATISSKDPSSVGLGREVDGKD